MIRRAVLSLTLLALFCPSVCMAQQEVTPSAQSAESGLPDFGARTVPGDAVVDLADFVCGNLEATGSVPDLAQVRAADGGLRTMTASEVLVLLARTAYLWRTTGSLPDTVPVTPDQIGPPVLDAEDVVAPPEDLDVGREIPTEQFLSQCPAVVRWADRLEVIPTAVWADGKRLSAAEYLAGLAICLSYAYWDEQLSDTIFLPIYAPPASWVQDAEPAYVATESGEGEEGGGVAQQVSESPSEAQPGEYRVEESPEEPVVSAEEEGISVGGEEEWGAGDQSGVSEEDYGSYSAYEGDVPQEAVEEEEYPEDFDESGAAEEPVYEIAPALLVIPEPGETVSGIVDVVASYSGPPARFVILTFDGKGDVMMNTPPYSSRWDTSKLEPGTHQVRIQVLGEDDQVLVDQTSAYTVIAPAPKKSPGAGK